MNTPNQNEEFAKENLENLTNRELQILNTASEGLCNKDIANQLGIAESTVKRHRKNTYKKFNISSDHFSIRKLLRWFYDLKNE